MIAIPAVDLREGACVQLVGGVARLALWQAMELISFGRFRPVCSAEVGE